MRGFRFGWRKKKKEGERKLRTSIKRKSCLKNQLAEARRFGVLRTGWKVLDGKQVDTHSSPREILCKLHHLRYLQPLFTLGRVFVIITDNIEEEAKGPFPADRPRSELSQPAIASLAGC